MKNPNFQCSLLMLAVCTLTACSSLSKAQCLSGNWHAIGYNDGVAGRYPSRISEHQQACAKTGVIPNFPAWESGRQQGLAHYCTEANARRLGESGSSFNAVCPANKINRLQSIHDKAYRHYQRQEEIRRDEQTLSRYRHELDQLRNGDMLDFQSESQAREYMLKLQKDILQLERKIRRNQRANNVY